MPFAPSGLSRTTPQERVPAFVDQTVLRHVPAHGNSPQADRFGFEKARVAIKLTSQERVLEQSRSQARSLEPLADSAPPVLRRSLTPANWRTPTADVLQATTDEKAASSDRHACTPRRWSVSNSGASWPTKTAP